MLPPPFLYLFNEKRVYGRRGRPIVLYRPKQQQQQLNVFPNFDPFHVLVKKLFGIFVFIVEIL